LLQLRWLHFISALWYRQSTAFWPCLSKDEPKFLLGHGSFQCIQKTSHRIIGAPGNGNSLCSKLEKAIQLMFVACLEQVVGFVVEQMMCRYTGINYLNAHD
jgi:hypothetical protein